MAIFKTFYSILLCGYAMQSSDNTLTQRLTNSILLQDLSGSKLGYSQTRSAQSSRQKILLRKRQHELDGRQQNPPKKSTSSGTATLDNQPTPTTASSSKYRFLNLITYKWHALGDYVKSIRLFGTTDSYSTQIVCCVFTTHLLTNLIMDVFKGEREHRRVKRFYARTNKNKFTRQCAYHEWRERILRNMKRKADKGKAKDTSANRCKENSLNFTDSEPLPFTAPKVYHHISESKRFYVDLTQWLGNNAGDPATKV